MSDSSLVPASAELATTELPAWITEPATPEPVWSNVFIDSEGQLYISGETSTNHGPIIPYVIGAITDISFKELGQNSRYGARPYLQVYLMTPIPNQFAVLNLPCKESIGPSGEPSTPWSVRSLVGHLAELDLRDTAVKLQTKRGTAATFFRVIPHDTQGNQLPEVRGENIGPRFGDLELAVDHLRKGLNLPPLTPDIAAHDV